MFFFPEFFYTILLCIFESVNVSVSPFPWLCSFPSIVSICGPAPFFPPFWGNTLLLTALVCTFGRPYGRPGCRCYLARHPFLCTCGVCVTVVQKSPLVSLKCGISSSYHQRNPFLHLSNRALGPGGGEGASHHDTDRINK